MRQTKKMIIFLSIIFHIGMSNIGFSNSQTSCIQRCIRSHPQWGNFICSEGEKFYIVGEGCYVVQNECFLECNMNSTESGTYLISPEQTTNQWRQKKACSPDIRKFPLEILPGNHLIDPSWSGQCECLNEKLIIGECGHNQTTCDEVCDSGVTF